MTAPTPTPPEIPTPRHRRPGLRVLGLTLAVLLLAAGMTALGGVVGGTHVRNSVDNPAPQLPLGATADIEASIRAAQERLRKVPTDASAWAVLGNAYLQQGRLKADPSYYGKADGALSQSLRIKPGNYEALTGQGALANSRHEFAAALALADRALAVDAYSAQALAVREDALMELGRYPEAFLAAQRLLDTHPGVLSFTRGSYVLELQGQYDRAGTALREALGVATSGPDKAFAQYYLGELQWNQGHFPEARSWYERALVSDPTYLAARAGEAKVLAATGRPADALPIYASVTRALPLPSYVLEYGELLQHLGRVQEARTQYDLVEAELALARAAGVNGDLELALFQSDHGDRAAGLRAAFQERKRRDSVLVDDALAWALHLAGRDREALEAAHHGQRLHSRIALASFHLGVIEAALGDKPAAVRDLRAALTQNPAFSQIHAPEARALITRLGG